jgi:hypothetical protein
MPFAWFAGTTIKVRRGAFDVRPKRRFVGFGAGQATGGDIEIERE